MELVLDQAHKTQGQVLMDLLQVQQVAVEASSKPLRPITGGTSSVSIDTYA